MSDDKRITVIVPKEMHLALKLEAAKRETTVSDILRSLIEDWLASREAQVASPARTP
ncbi:MAG: plasmid partition protein ParG [Chloroflexota bacterium]